MTPKDDLEDISDTTIEEKPDPFQEWTVEGVLAETDGDDGSPWYLVDWTGFDLHDASWEPLENLAEETLTAWDEKKSLVNEYENICGWYKAKVLFAAGRLARAKSRDARREARKLPKSDSLAKAQEALQEEIGEAERAGLTLEDIGIRRDDIGLQDSGESDVDEDILRPPKALTNPKRTASSNLGQTKSSAARSKSPSREGSTHGAVTGAQKGAGKSPRSSTKSLPQKPDAPASDPAKSRSRPTAGYQGTAKRIDSAVVRPKPSANAATSASTSASASRPHGATSGQSTRQLAQRSSSGLLMARRSSAATAAKVAKTLGPNIFVGGKTQKPRRDIGQIMSDSSTNGRFFSNLRIKNIAYKRGRDKADQAPATLPSGLFPITAGPRHDRGRSQSTRPSKHIDIDLTEDTSMANTDTGGAQPSPMTEQAPDGVPKRKKRKSVRFSETDMVASPPELSPPPIMEGSLSSEPMDLDVESNLFVPEGPSASPAPGPMKSEPPASSTREATPHPSSIRKVSLQDYHAKQQLTVEIHKTLVFGPDGGRKVEVVLDGILGLSDAHAGYTDFVRDGLLSFTHLCTAQDLKFQLESVAGTKIGSGYVSSSASPELLQHMAERLKLGYFGAVCFGKTYCVMVFPARADAWKEIDKILGTEPTTSPPAIEIRHIVFAKGPDARPSPDAELVQPWERGTPGKIRKVAFERILGFDYSTILPAMLQGSAGGRKEVKKVKEVKEVKEAKGASGAPTRPLQHGFFLAFPPCRGPLLQAVVLWLRECDPECVVMTARDTGAWNAFRTMTSCGTIIFHELSLPSIRRFPKMSDMMRAPDSRFTVWCLGESLRRFPLVPSASARDGRVYPPAQIKLHRILPCGKAILVTPSFLVTKPAQALELFSWYAASVAATRHVRQTKLVVCHGIEDWLSEVARQKGREECEIRAKLWDLVYRLVQQSNDSNDVCKDEEASPLVFSPEVIDANDEQSLFNWFMHWTSTNLDYYRKFIVVGTNEVAPKHSSGPAIRCKIPRYERGTVANPDLHAKEVERALLEDEERVRTAQHPPPATAMAMAATDLDMTNAFHSVLLSDDDRAETIVDFLNPRVRASRGFIIMYDRPVSFYNLDMADYYGHFTTSYETFKGWFSFVHPFLPRKPTNTYCGLFYTITGKWDGSKPAPPPHKPPPRHPWVAIYRPVNPHNWTKKGLPKDEFEVIIWDCAADRMFPGPKQPTEDGLMEAQRELIEFLRRNTGEKNPGTRISRVWLGGFQPLVEGSPSALPMDVTLTFLENLLTDGKTNAPSAAFHLEQRGFRRVERHAAMLPPVSSVQVPKEELGKGNDKENDEDVDKEEDDEDDDGSPPRMIFHPPRGNGLIRPSRCENHFFKKAMAAKKEGKGPYFTFRFLATLQWYGIQKEEGRGAEHIMVAPWANVSQELEVGEPNRATERGSASLASP